MFFCKELPMTNFELFNQTLMHLFLDLHLGLSLPLRRMLAMLTTSLLEGTPAHLTALARKRGKGFREGSMKYSHQVAQG
jgi:hypothetical protein